MWKIIKAFLAAIFGLEAKPTEPSTTDLAAQAATANATAQQEKSANDVLQEGAAARAAADARQLRLGNGDPAAVNLDPAAPVNASPDAHFRD